MRLGDRFGAKTRAAPFGLMSAFTGYGHAAELTLVRVVPDIVAKVPNCPAVIFLLSKNPTDDR